MCAQCQALSTEIDNETIQILRVRTLLTNLTVSVRNKSLSITFIYLLIRTFNAGRAINVYTLFRWIVVYFRLCGQGRGAAMWGIAGAVRQRSAGSAIAEPEALARRFGS